MQQSHIYFNATSKKWTLRSLANPDKFIETVSDLPNKIPVGSYKWQTGSVNSLCYKHKGYVSEMTFSKCFPNKYTCNSGHCIELHKKCNTAIDCKDKSDEHYCNFLRFGGNYEKGQLPVYESGEPLTVYINVSVLGTIHILRQHFFEFLSSSPQSTGGRVNLNFLVTPYGVAFLNP